ncbi:amidohydrolase family protein [Streptomyces sp. NPDC003247]|uniref:amidohydrolase family protein n=1 Tax=Streptomyces sp. NPDC003247 TaxID=3364677 RepID=UPI0036AAAA1C
MPAPAHPRTVQVLGVRHSPGPALPDGACDTHVHLFDPADRYPYAADRGYLPPDALPADLRALHRHLGISRTVLVQPSPYGTDNTRLLRPTCDASSWTTRRRSTDGDRRR